MTTPPPPDRAALLAEFDAQPFGRHSAALQETLNRVRSVPVAGKSMLYMTQPHRRWARARLSASTPLQLEVDASRQYDDLLVAEREVLHERLADVAPGATGYDHHPAACSLLGYADRDSVRAGEEITFFVSSERDPAYEADIVRLRHPEVGPSREPYRADVLDSPFSGHHTSQRQPLHPGSYIRIDRPVALPDSFTLTVLARPTRPGPDDQVVLSLRATTGDWVLAVAADGALTWSWRPVDGEVVTASVAGSADGGWSFVGAWFDAPTSTLGLYTTPVARRAPWAASDERVETAPVTYEAGPTVDVLIAAGHGPRTDADPTPDRTFNGLLERPRIWSGVSDRRVLAEEAAHPGTSPERLVADWDFAADIPTETVTDRAGSAHGRTVNLPARAVRGARWTGHTLDWRTAPAQYAAIHLHDDDLADPDWRPTFSLRVPEDWSSGCYALWLRAGEDEFFVPFFVRPARGGPHHDVAFVVPTATYAAYANMRARFVGQSVELQQGRLTVVDSTDLLLLQRPEIGASTYDAHSDGSPVMYSTLRRPVTNYRPKGRIYKLCLDLLITAWLDHEGVPFDVVTDEDIHREGRSAVADYRVLVTSSHPEYMSESIEDTVADFLASGGRLMYLGGNGFYTAAEFHPGRRGTVEVRRPGMPDLWPLDHTEGHFSLTGRPAGNFANLGRRSEPLVGVAFDSQGFDACTSYRRRPDSDDPRAGFIFDGVVDRVIGDFGLLQGGAAGYEIDRFSRAWGSPPHALWLASSSGHSNVYEIITESLVESLLTDEPDPPDPIRADLVFFETRGGGAVFSVGSIAWAGCLGENHYDNNVAAVSRNVLRRFCSAEPFEVPAHPTTTREGTSA